MAPAIDYNALRAQTLSSGTDEEAVTVNTRALIDKVLARYSGEWTTLRELLQNAADASATKVAIKFETIPSATIPVPQDASPSSTLQHVLLNHTLKRLLVTNNGKPFTENDWARLKRIAEGNPDETKIGAFGVGFYSVFAECEEPFVSSGNEAMAFYWKHNSLFTRRLQIPIDRSSEETSFVLDYRNDTSAVPPLLSLAQFLANSLTFVGLETIELILDDWTLLSLSKKSAPSVEVAIPKDIETKTSDGYMKIRSVEQQVAQIDGSWMKIISWKLPNNAQNRSDDQRGSEAGPSLRTFFSRLAGGPASSRESQKPSVPDSQISQDWTEKVSRTIFLHTYTASIKTLISSNFSSELERATKKPPPKSPHLSILTAPYQSLDQDAKPGSSKDIFATVLPTKSGRIFIGFPTHQTTGLSAHVSAPSVIPTVERESIDLNARWVRTWNIEMLRIAGIVCRVAYVTEMMTIRQSIRDMISKSGKSRIRLEDVKSVLPEAINTAKNFSFRESTPAAQTGQTIEDSFWTCTKTASVDILSTNGVLPTHQVRIAPKELTFMEGIPVVPEQLATEAKTFVDKLIDFGLLTEITVSDIRTALETTPLSTTQVGEFLDWIGKQHAKGQLDKGTVKSLLSVAVASDGVEGAENTKILMLGTMQYYLNPSRIPVEMPMPPSVMPFKYTKSLPKGTLDALGWTEMHIVPWLRWLLEESGKSLLAEQDITRSPVLATQVLLILSKQWENMSQSTKDTIKDLLSEKAIMPTKLGLKKPSESYFPSVRLFADLPVVVGLNSVKDKVLLAIGVRKTIELNIVFDRLLSENRTTTQTSEGEKPRWSHVNLVQYLASVREDIPATDIARLKNTAICPRESKKNTQSPSEKNYKVSELFEPRPVLRELGLPCLSWPGIFRGNSVEGRFLFMLGLRSAPTVMELIQIMASAGSKKDLELRDKALTYFLNQHQVNGYAAFDYQAVTIPFLPLQDSQALAAPSQCFTNEGSSLLGFKILAKGLHQHATRFGVRPNPPIDQCIDLLLKNPPTTKHGAREMFAYFAGRLNEIPAGLPRLATAKFIPIFTKSQMSPTGKSAGIRYVTPKTCFLGDSDTFGEIFDFVDFGQDANTFLLKCGSKQDPSMIEVAEIMVREPGRISSIFRNPEKYLELLRRVAQSLPALKKNKDLFREMKKAPFLLASKTVMTEYKHEKAVESLIDADADLDDYEEEDSQGIKEWQLTSAENALIIDDYSAYGLFRDSILAAPQENDLEDFYYNLGSPMLSSLVEEAARHGPRAGDQSQAAKLHKIVLERVGLFIHDQSPDQVKHDARWLEKNLSIQTVSHINLRRSLRGRNLSHVERRSAVVTGSSDKEYVLWIAGSSIDMYQVSQALVHLLLNRPKLHNALTLEMLLKTDLRDLQRRGFNVGRILRRKAAEQRMADVVRQQALEEERRKIEEQEKAWKESQAQRKVNQVPGGFPAPDEPHSVTPDNEDTVLQAPRGGLLSNLTRQFKKSQGGQQLQSMLNNNTQNQRVLTNGSDPPPPYFEGSKGEDVEAVTAPHQTHENLLRAIKQTRAHNSSEVFNRGETNQVTETTSYCDERPAHDLTYIAEGKFGIRIFLSTSATPDSSSFLSTNAAGLSIFATLLEEIVTVFGGMNTKSINIFYQPRGRSIAFNASGSIFCNYLYFSQLHEEALKQGRDRQEAFVYWFVILCHELAHNLVADHSSNHSFYTESFVMQYFTKVMSKLGESKAA